MIFKNKVFEIIKYHANTRDYFLKWEFLNRPSVGILNKYKLKNVNIVSTFIFTLHCPTSVYVCHQSICNLNWTFGSKTLMLRSCKVSVICITRGKLSSKSDFRGRITFLSTAWHTDLQRIGHTII